MFIKEKKNPLLLLLWIQTPSITYPFQTQVIYILCSGWELFSFQMRENMWNLSFLCQAYLNTMPFCCVQFAINVRIFLIMAEYHSLEYRFHIFLFHSFDGRHLRWFHILAFVSSVIQHDEPHVLWYRPYSILWVNTQQWNCWDCMVIVFLVS